MVTKTTSFKLDSELLKQIKIRATEKDLTQSELVTIYLKNGLKYDLSENDLNIIQFLNSQSHNHLNKLKKDFEVPEMLKYDPKKENKPITEEDVVFEDEGGTDIFNKVIDTQKTTDGFLATVISVTIDNVVRSEEEPFFGYFGDKQVYQMSISLEDINAIQESLSAYHFYFIDDNGEYKLTSIEKL